MLTSHFLGARHYAQHSKFISNLRAPTHCELGYPHVTEVGAEAQSSSATSQ